MSLLNDKVVVCIKIFLNILGFVYVHSFTFTGKYVTERLLDTKMSAISDRYTSYYYLIIIYSYIFITKSFIAKVFDSKH